MITAVALASSLVTVVRPSKRLGKRILFVCDVSGSMSGTPFSKALNTVRAIASQPVDEMEIGIIAFADKPLRWKPSPKHAPKETWVKLPDARMVRRGGRWLHYRGASGGTRVIPALEAALKEPKKDLTIVLVTDGIFMETDNDIVKAVETAQKKRIKRKRGRALIAVLGIGEEQTVLRRLGRDGRGGYFRVPTEDEKISSSGK